MKLPGQTGRQQAIAALLEEVGFSGDIAS